MNSLIAVLLNELRDPALELRAILALCAGKPPHRREARAGQRQEPPSRFVDHSITRLPIYPITQLLNSPLE
jgi:hypothetical protein